MNLIATTSPTSPAAPERTLALPAAPAVWRLVAAFTLARLLLAALAPLTPQEAYYWSWSQFPSPGYFDHPPLATYSIWLTTHLVGKSVFGVKLAAVLWSLGWNLLLARLVREQFRDARLAFWALLALNLTLLYEIFGVSPTPDAPLLFGWVGTVWALGRVRLTGQGRWWLVAGFFLGLACMGKYPGALLGPVALAWVLLSPGQRRWLLRPEPYLAVLVAVLVFSPVLLWNAQHDWVSLTFQSTRRLGEMGSRFKPRFFAVLLATQALLLTPYVFWIAVRAAVAGGRALLARRLDDGERLLWVAAAVPLAIFVVASFRGNVKINWLIPVWWPLIVLGARAVLADPGRLRRLRAGLASAAVITVMGLGLTVVPNLPLPDDLNTWSGWPEAAARVDQVETQLRAGGERTFVFSPNYKISALIWFYRQRPERTYAHDILGERALQFDMFPQPADGLKGATGLLVLSDQSQSEIDLTRQVAPLFDRVERVAVVDAGGARRIEIYRCSGYKGKAAAHAGGPRD